MIIYEWNIWLYRMQHMIIMNEICDNNEWNIWLYMNEIHDYKWMKYMIIMNGSHGIPSNRIPPGPRDSSQQDFSQTGFLPWDSSHTGFLPHGIPPKGFLPRRIPPTHNSSHTEFLPRGIPPTQDSSQMGFLPHRIPPTQDSSHMVFLPQRIPLTVVN